MLKRCLLAVIVALIMTSSQIAAAVDWNNVPRLNNRAELATYIETGRRNGQTEFNFILTYLTVNDGNELQNLSQELGNRIATAPSSNLAVETFGTGRFTYRVTKEYAGMRVANAYINGDTSNLTSEEMQLYNIAVGIVNNANGYSSEMDKARYIHDEIRRTVQDFQNFTNPDAVGALVKRRTNCQGYSDAFYMLGRMCNLNVRMIGGSAVDNQGQWGNHQWNTITFNDGRTYFVDVTNGSLFCVGRSVLQRDHTCEWDAISNLQ
jgi:transglutaminase/protease-like cytokinesis protein 3